MQLRGATLVGPRSRASPTLRVRDRSTRSDTQLPDNGGVSVAAYLRVHVRARSGRSSRIHSASALIPDSHQPPALWLSL
jgi:hypothetical protein